MFFAITKMKSSIFKFRENLQGNEEVQSRSDLSTDNQVEIRFVLSLLLGQSLLKIVTKGLAITWNYRLKMTCLELFGTDEDFTQKNIFLY